MSTSYNVKTFIKKVLTPCSPFNCNVQLPDSLWSLASLWSLDVFWLLDRLRPVFDRLQYCKRSITKAWERGYILRAHQAPIIWLHAPFVMIMSHSAARCIFTTKYNVILKIVLPARQWLHLALICLHADCCHLWNYICFYTHKTVAQAIRRDYSQDKSNLVTIIWWLCRRAIGKG